MDAGSDPDSATGMDSGVADDAAAADAGPIDASSFDGGPMDAGPPPRGHLVLIGHFYGVESTNEDRMLCNAVLLSERGDDVAVLQYTEHVDSGWDVPARVAPILSSCAAGRGRSTSFSDLGNFADLGTMLPSHDVLLVYHQVNATREKMNTVSAAWNTTLNDFLDDGGVLVVIDDSGVGGSGSGGTFLIASGSGLMNVTSATSVVGDPLVVADSGDPVADGVSDYMAPTGSSGYPLSTGGTVVIHERDGLVPVVRHLVRMPP